MSTLKHLVKTGFIMLLLAFMANPGKAQLHADFSATPTSGCSPLVVNFSDSSTGNPTQWRWDLGNGTISFLQNPSATYFTPGQYTVKLVIQKAGGIDSVVKTNYITIYPQPSIEFTASPRSGCFPLPVQFTDQSTTPSGTISQWQWDFGDGTFGNTQNPVHTYTAGGNYNVSLVVTNSHGCFRSMSKNQFVQVAQGVTADFSNNLPNSCVPPVNINFQNLSTGLGTLNYQWNFGDGNTSTQLAPSHVYTTPGSYTVQLIVTNSTGCSDTIIKPNAVTIGNTVTSFTSPDTVCAGVNITFNNTSTPPPASASWTFGDGSTSTSISPVKSYILPGTYQVKLINNFGACVDSTTRNIVISPLPSVNFFTADTLSCNAPYTVRFTSNCPGAVTYQWLFGDGTTSSDPNPVHTYTTAGNFTVRLICTNIYGCSNNTIKQDYIKIQLPVASISNLPQQGCAPFEWTFSSTVNSIEPITGYFWDFGDGGTSTLANPTHIFGPGTFTIKLIVTTASGCTDTVTVGNGIRTGTKPVAGFSASPRDVCANVTVNFSDLSTGNVDQWHWDFGDGSTSNVQNPNHVYNDTGYFNVQLIVWNNGCPDTLDIQNYIHVKPPIASYTVASNCSERLKRTFTDTSIGADEWNWDFGDGNTSTVQHPVHVYAASGVYTVSLTVGNFSTGCTYTHTSTVRVISESPGFTVTDTVICRNNTVTFTSTGSNPANIGAYQWNFGDGATATGQSVTHTYTVSGLYDITMIMVDWNGCRDTIVKQHFIRVNGPTANFSASPRESCLLNTVTFADSSLSDGVHPITQWIWNYGDGIIDTLTAGPFQHTYVTAGMYTVTLTVSDNNGCTDSLALSNYLTISRPVADFNADTLSCPGTVIQFLNSSTGTGLLYNWDFGDGAISINANPVHAYTANGYYTVRLVIHDQFGCSDTITKTNYIHIVTPVADFTVSDSVGTCPPLIVAFTNTSQYYNSLSWDFGDGTSTTNPNPSHFYNTAGTFIAKLTITGPGGCTATKEQTITVRGPSGTFTYDPLSGCSPTTVSFRASTQGRISFIWDFADGNTMATNDSIVTHTYSIVGSYVPKMILQDISGCTVAITGLDTIRIHGVNADFNFTPPIVCNSGSVQFNNASTSADAITAYAWDFGDGNTAATANPVHFYSTPGLYFPSLKVTTAFGCSDSIISSIPVRIVASPQGQLTQTANGCTPVTVTFTGSLAVPDTSSVTWQWNFGNGNSSSLPNPPAQTYSVAGTYPVTLFVTNSSGCVDTVTTSVQAFALPNVNAGTDMLVCKGTGRNLQATGAASYIWTPATGLSCTNCANPVANPDSAITYTVTGTSTEGCIQSDDVRVTVQYPFDMSSSVGDTICKGSSLRLFASGAHTYTWSPSTGLNSATSATPTASPLVTTLYTVIGKDDKNCFSDTAYIPVTVYGIPTVEAGADKTINVGQVLDLVPAISSDVREVNWSPTGSIFRNSFPAISIKPKETTTFTVEVKNEGGCTARDNVTVYVLCNDANVFIPNTFSPNGDGANDVFYPRGKGLFRIKSARVFNRWGEVVYEKGEFAPNDASSGWDGTYKGRKLNADVFIYMIEILCDNNTVLVYKGNVALIN